jgi:hypothetical protein
MERTQLFDLMGELKLYGMKAAFDEIMATAVKRQHEPQRIIGDICRSLSPEGNSSSTLSVASTSAPQSSSLPTSHSASGRASSVIPR